MTVHLHHMQGALNSEASSPWPYLIGLLITSHHAHSLYKGVARVVHSGLDALVQCVAVGCHLVSELGVDGGSEALSHTVVVFSQVRVVCAVGGERLWASSPRTGLSKTQFLCDLQPGALDPVNTRKI